MKYLLHQKFAVSQFLVTENSLALNVRCLSWSNNSTNCALNDRVQCTIVCEFIKFANFVNFKCTQKFRVLQYKGCGTFFEVGGPWWVSAHSAENFFCGPPIFGLAPPFWGGQAKKWGGQTSFIWLSHFYLTLSLRGVKPNYGGMPK